MLAPPIRFSTAVCGLTAIITWAGFALTGLAQTRPQVPTLNYNKDTFYIPFNADVLSPEITATEVLLFVSGDKGQSWQLYQRQAPSAKRFAFRAAIDGEYWFAVRTSMADNTEATTSGLEPELKVVLDTKKPELDLSAALLNASEAGVVWGIKDANLAPNTLRMEYRTSSVGVWQPILPSAVKTIEQGYTGETTWQLTQPAESMEIRASVKDTAGNETRIADTIRPVRSTSEATQPKRDLGLSSTVRVDAPARKGDVFLTPQRATEPAVAHRSGPEGWKSVPKQQSPIRVDRVPSSPIIENHTLQSKSDVVDPTNSSALLTSAGPAQPQPPVASQVNRPPSVATQSPTPPNNAPARLERPVSLPVPTQAHMSASKQFHLDYDVEATSLNRVARVSLWATMDNGRTWTLYGEDPDKISPFLVDVPNDGIYGFRMLIENSEGIAPKQPQSGDAADVWIHVDSTKPTARIVSARFGRNANLGQLQIYWDAADQNLPENPITLLYSDRAEGPWRVIAEQIANTSRFDWNVKESVPSDFYLQLEVRDTAGNVSRDTLRDPISRDGLAPRGVIKDVRPATNQMNTPTTGLNSGQLPSAIQTPIAPPTTPRTPADGPSLGPAQVPATLDYPQSRVDDSVEVMEAKLPGNTVR